MLWRNCPRSLPGSAQPNSAACGVVGGVEGVHFCAKFISFISESTLPKNQQMYTLPKLVFPKIRVPQNGCFIMEKIPLKWMIWGYPYFRKHPNRGVNGICFLWLVSFGSLNQPVVLRCTMILVGNGLIKLPIGLPYDWCNWTQCATCWHYKQLRPYYYCLSPFIIS